MKIIFRKHIGSDMSHMSPQKKYLIIGLNRREDSWYIIWMDIHMSHTDYKILDFDDVLFHVDVCSETETITLTGLSGICCFDFCGIRPNFVKKTWP